MYLDWFLYQLNERPRLLKELLNFTQRTLLLCAVRHGDHEVVVFRLTIVVLHYSDTTVTELQCEVALALAVDVVAMELLLAVDIVCGDLAIEDGVLVIAEINEAVSALGLEVAVHIEVLEDIYLVESFTILLEQTIVSSLTTILYVLLVCSVVDSVRNNSCTLAHMLTS